MPRLVSRQSIFFDSENALLETPDCSFTVLLNHQLLGNASYIVLTLNQLSLRNTIQTVSIFNNQLVWNGSLLELPVGNTSFPAIQAFLNANGIDIALDPETMHVVFHTAGTVSFPPNSCAGILGFEELSSYDILAGDTAPFRMLLGDYDLLYLKTNLSTSNVEIDDIGNTTPSQILCSIPNVSRAGGLLVFTDPYKTYSVISRNVEGLNQIEIRLTDARGNKIVMESLWTLSLSLEYYSEADDEALESINNSLQELVRLQRMKIISKSLPVPQKKSRNILRQ